jgi:predicted RNase H-like nuclease (RuvC/YqgF family)
MSENVSSEGVSESVKSKVNWADVRDRILRFANNIVRWERKIEYLEASNSRQSEKAVMLAKKIDELSKQMYGITKQNELLVDLLKDKLKS